MKCPKCKGVGWVSAERKICSIPGHEDWDYEDVRCYKCKGKGFLTPEEQALDKF